MPDGSVISSKGNIDTEIMSLCESSYSYMSSRCVERVAFHVMWKKKEIVNLLK